MLHNIDMKKLNDLKKQNPEFAQIIDALLYNHDTVMASVRHEIRNPLALVSSMLQLLEKNQPAVRSYKYWQTTLVELANINLLLESLSASSGTIKPEHDYIDAYEFAVHLDEIYSARAEQKNIPFSTTIPDSLPYILGDRIRLLEVFNNVFKNALDSLDSDGQINITFTEDYSEEIPYLVSYVSDTGCGIPSDKIDSIFEEFQTYKIHGTGLGLSISREIIETHGGTISAVSTVGSGTTVIIKLPIQYHC